MMGLFKRGRATAALCATFFAVTLTTLVPAKAESVVRIGSNSGGRIGEFMVKLRQHRNSDSLVKFDGSCDSACTLLMALPRNKTCITSNAVFRFHAPTGGSVRTSQSAKRFMMAQYPGWVRSWISRNNGLTGRLISMDYSYASKFMRSCNQVAQG
jgi:hypothetical protein